MVQTYYHSSFLIADPKDVWVLQAFTMRPRSFLRYETLHQATLHDYATRIALYEMERDTLERQIITGAQTCRDQPFEDRIACSRRCFDEAGGAEARWTERALATKSSTWPGLLYSLAWCRINRAARMPGVAS